MKQVLAAAVLSFLVGPSMAQAQLGTAFTYQGRLTDAGSPPNGAYDFEFQLFDAATFGTGSTVQTRDDVTVTNGLFTVTLDFGAVFTGSPQWLEVRVRAAASTGAYTALAPRQELTPTPNAVFSASAANATTVAGLTCTDGQVVKWSGSAWTCGTDSGDAYDSLTTAGYLDNNAGTDLLTRIQADGRFAASAHAHGDGDIDAYTDLSASGRLDNNTSTDLLTRTQLDARYLLSGDNARFYGCGLYVDSGSLGYCPSPFTDGPNCDDVPAGAFCEADGECGLSTAPTAGCGANSWYLKLAE